MRAAAELFTVLASIATIIAVSVRVWWSKPRPTPQDTMPDDPPKAPQWLRKMARFWLYFVVFGATVAAIIIVAVFIIRIIDLST